jgi:hypothetical protein
MGKNRENHYKRYIGGGSTKFMGVVHVRNSYYIYSEVLTLREAYAWTEWKVKELNNQIVKAYVQTWTDKPL